MVRTENATLAHVDLFGKKLRVGSVVDTGGNAIVQKGSYTLADAQANGWTWFEDSVGGGVLEVGLTGLRVTLR